MIKFKIKSYGITGGVKSWLSPSTKELPYIFSLSDARFISAFSASVINKMSAAKKHGAKITLRKGRLYHIFIEVINKEDGINQKKNLVNMKRLAIKLSKSEDVQSYFDTVRKIKTLDYKYEPPLKT